MKKLIITGFLALAAVGSLSAQNQQFTVGDLDGNIFTDGQVLGFNVHGTFGDPIEEAKVFFVYHNTSTTDSIRFYSQVVEMTNTDGMNAQFCNIFDCYFPMVEGAFYPNDGAVLAPNEYNGQNGFNYFINLDENSPVEYKLRFFQANVETGVEIPNTSLHLTYRYDENMGLTEVQSISIADVYPTVAKGFTNVTLKENAKLQILNSAGKSVRTTSLSSGNSQINLNGLSGGVYWLSFKGDSGKTTSTRIVVK